MEANVNRNRTLKLLVVVSLMVACLLPLVAHSSPPKAQADEPTIFNITMKEYQFVVEGQKDGDPIQLETGKPYRFVIKNIGTQEHEVLIGSEPLTITGGYKHDFTTNLLADVETVLTSGADESAFTIGAAGLNEFELLVDQQLAIEFTLPDSKVGDWEMACFVSLEPNAPEDNPGPGHYDVGMHIPVKIVQGAAS